LGTWQPELILLHPSKSATWFVWTQGKSKHWLLLVKPAIFYGRIRGAKSISKVATLNSWWRLGCQPQGVRMRIWIGAEPCPLKDPSSIHKKGIDKTTWRTLTALAQFVAQVMKWYILMWFHADTNSKFWPIFCTEG